jgi:outer membrane lipoprotein SlyB
MIWHWRCSLNSSEQRYSFIKPFSGGATMTKIAKYYSNRIISVGLFALSLAGCAGGDLTTREKGAAIGVVGGAAAGGIVGATMGRPGVGAAIGGALGLGAGALVGDYMQGQEQSEANQQQIQQNQRTIERNRQQIQQPSQSEY